MDELNEKFKNDFDEMKNHLQKIETMGTIFKAASKDFDFASNRIDEYIAVFKDPFKFLSTDISKETDKLMKELQLVTLMFCNKMTVLNEYLSGKED